MKKKKKLKKTNQFYFNFLIFLFIFFLPTQLGKFFFFPFSYISGIRIDYLAYAFYFTDILAILLIVLNIKRILNFLKNKIVFSVFILLMLSVFFSFSIQITFYKLLKILEILSLYTIFKHLKINKKVIISALLSSTLIQVFLSLFHVINRSSIQSFFYYFGERYISTSMPGIAKASLNGVEIMRPYGTFSHPNSMAGFYLLIYSFVLGLNFKKNQIIKNVLLLLFSFLILISFSKSAIFSLLIVNIIYVIISYKKSICKFCAVTKVFALFLLSLVFFFAKTDPLSIIKRVELIKNSITLIEKYPLTGVGLGNYLIAQNSIILKSSFLIPQPVHNIFLLIFSEVGLFLGTAILYLILKYFYKFRRVYSLAFCLCAILITGSLDHYWITLQQNLLLVAVVFGLITNSQVDFEKFD